MVQTMTYHNTVVLRVEHLDLIYKLESGESQKYFDSVLRQNMIEDYDFFINKSKGEEEAYITVYGFISMSTYIISKNPRLYDEIYPIMISYLHGYFKGINNNVRYIEKLWEENQDLKTEIDFARMGIIKGRNRLWIDDMNAAADKVSEYLTTQGKEYDRYPVIRRFVRKVLNKSGIIISLY